MKDLEIITKVNLNENSYESAADRREKAALITDAINEKKAANVVVFCLRCLASYIFDTLENVSRRNSKDFVELAKELKSDFFEYRKQLKDCYVDKNMSLSEIRERMIEILEVKEAAEYDLRVAINYLLRKMVEDADCGAKETLRRMFGYLNEVNYRPEGICVSKECFEVAESVVEQRSILLVSFLKFKKVRNIMNAGKELLSKRPGTLYDTYGEAVAEMDVKVNEFQNRKLPENVSSDILKSFKFQDWEFGTSLRIPLLSVLNMLEEEICKGNKFSIRTALKVYEVAQGESESFDKTMAYFL